MCFEIGIHGGQRQDGAALVDEGDQRLQGVARRVVDIGDPEQSSTSHRTGCGAASISADDVVGEPVRIGVEQFRVVTEHHQAGQRFGPRDRRGVGGIAVWRHADDEPLRRVLPPDHVQDGQHDGQDDALLDAEREHHDAGDGGDDELVTPCGPEPPKTLDVDQVVADQEHDRAEHRAGHVGQQVGQEQHDHEDHRGHGQVRDLGTAVLFVQDLGLRRTAVDHERAGEPGGQVGPGQTDEVAVDVHPVSVPDGETTATSRRFAR